MFCFCPFRALSWGYLGEEEHFSEGSGCGGDEVAKKLQPADNKDRGEIGMILFEGHCCLGLASVIMLIV